MKNRKLPPIDRTPCGWWRRNKVTDKILARKQHRLNELYNNALYKKRWRNIGQFCNRKTHPFVTGYRRYRRGKNRCKYCGAKIGKVKCRYKSAREMIVDNIFSSNPIFDMLKTRR